MKKNIYVLLVLGLMVGGMECSAQTVSGQMAGHDYVDMGLESGTLWATYNVGATKPSEYGDYFIWGDTLPKNEPSLDSKYMPADSLYYKESSASGKRTYIRLHPKYDAARANWGDDWRMPTRDEWRELINNCLWEKSENLYIGTSIRNGNKIYLPKNKWDCKYFSANGLENKSAISTITTRVDKVKKGTREFVKTVEHLSIGNSYFGLAENIRAVAK